MKKKLLIALGCSYTEGMGCYDFTDFPKHLTVYSDGVTREQIDHQYNQFHKKSWPVKLGKLLGYDKVLNLGYSGSSQSSNMKIFMQKYRNFDFQEYDVFVLWWIPSSHRFSFYRNGYVYNIIPHSGNTESDEVTTLGKHYLNFIVNYPEDCVLETKFYLDLMEDFCKLKNYKLLWVSQDDIYLKNTNKSTWLECPVNNFWEQIEDNINPSCSHPNEKGYDIISKLIYNSLKEKHPYLLSETSSSNMEWIWDGAPIEMNIEAEK